MLRSLRISQLGVIDDAELELSPGLNVITGETGAGKTMVVSGLGLLLGSRADAGLVRVGARAAVVEGVAEVGEGHQASQRVIEAGGEVDDGSLILVRTINAERGSKAHVGGRAAPIGVLAEVGQHLVAVHGQADQWRLRDPEQHRMMLDSAGGTELAKARTAYQGAFSSWTRAQKTLLDLTTSGAERAREAQMLRTALDEIGAINPAEGEEDDLQADEARLGHATGLRSAAQATQVALSGDDDGGPQDTSVLELLAQAAHELTQVSEHDPAIEGFRERLNEISYLSSDLATEMASYANSIDADPGRLAQVQQRRSTITAMLRNYGDSTAEVLKWAQASALRLADLDTSSERIEAAQAEVKESAAAVVKHGKSLRRAREKAAAELSANVTSEVRHLAMGSATVEVVVIPRTAESGDDGALEVAGARCIPRPHGLEDVEIRLAANPGAPARSVTKAASGGELSRVMLALELVASANDVPTYVFDEVDAGVGGSAALDLGARLAKLAQTAQVLVVTHLGQVAAFADHHLVVQKDSDGQVTSSDVHAVTGNDRVVEIARMLGGVTDSAAALEHARELLADNSRTFASHG